MARPARSMSSREFNQRTGEAKRAASYGAVYITDRGRPSHVLMSYQHYRKLIEDRPSLVDLLCRTPGVGEIDVDFPRLGTTAQPATFD